MGKKIKRVNTILKKDLTTLIDKEVPLPIENIILPKTETGTEETLIENPPESNNINQSSTPVSPTATTTTSTSAATNTSFLDKITKIDTTLRIINSIKGEVCKLPLDPCEKEFILNDITPILAVLTALSSVSANLATSVAILTTNPIVSRKKHKIKETIHTIYDINDQCDDLYEIIEKRVDLLTNSND